MVEPTAHNGSDAGSNPASPTNSPVTISFRATPEEVARIDAAVAFDRKPTRAEWLKGYVMSMVEIVEDEAAQKKREGVCKVDISQAPGLMRALGSIDKSIGVCIHNVRLREPCLSCDIENSRS